MPLAEISGPDLAGFRANNYIRSVRFIGPDSGIHYIDRLEQRLDRTLGNTLDKR
ncbi:MAG TPA: hypothetical protein PK587_02370 [Syntrophales bacterium]|nr:hypothetical protein [Syntrophales bacterium]